MPPINIPLQNYNNFSISDRREARFGRDNIANIDQINEADRREMRTAITKMGLFDRFCDWAFHHGAKKEALTHFADALLGDPSEKMNAAAWLLNNLTLAGMESLSVSLSKDGLSLKFSEGVEIKNIKPTGNNEGDKLFFDALSNKKGFNGLKNVIPTCDLNEINSTRGEQIDGADKCDCTVEPSGKKIQLDIIPVPGPVPHSNNKALLYASYETVLIPKKGYYEPSEISCIANHCIEKGKDPAFIDTNVVAFKHTLGNAGKINSELTLLDIDTLTKILPQNCKFDGFSSEKLMKLSLDNAPKELGCAIKTIGSLSEKLGDDSNKYIVHLSLNITSDNIGELDEFIKKRFDGEGVRCFQYMEDKKDEYFSEFEEPLELPYNYLLIGCTTSGMPLDIHIKSDLNEIKNFEISATAISQSKYKDVYLGHHMSAEQVFDGIKNFNGIEISSAGEQSMMLAKYLANGDTAKLNKLVDEQGNVDSASIEFNGFEFHLSLRGGNMEGRGRIILNAAEIYKSDNNSNDSIFDFNSVLKALSKTERLKNYNTD